jgi:hypothetical protein
VTCVQWHQQRHDGSAMVVVVVVVVIAAAPSISVRVVASVADGFDGSCRQGFNLWNFGAAFWLLFSSLSKILELKI